LGISGFLQQIFPSTPEINFYWICIFVFAYFTVFNGMYRRLFEVDRDRPFLYWIFELNCWAPLFLLPLALWGWKTEILPFFLYSNALMTLVYLALAFQLWRRNPEHLSAMLIAMMVSVAGILIAVSHNLGIIEGGFFVWHSLQFTALGSELILYVSLGARYRKISEARVQAEQNAKNEKEHRMLQGNFLAMLSHELRTSLTVLRMAIETQPMKPENLVKARRAMGSMGEVIDHSIHVEKLTEGKVVIERLPCDLAVLVQAVIADSREPTRMRFDFQGPCYINTDSRLLRIVITNLVDNALKYGHAEELVQFELSATNSDHPCIVISNAAGLAGLPDPQRVFEKYYRAPGAHAFTGSGLGLHIAFSLSRMLGAVLSYKPSGELVVFELHL
jgi:signal transduction histidine kinase